MKVSCMPARLYKVSPLFINNVKLKHGVIQLLNAL